VNEPHPPAGAVDPVCGMSVEPVVARARNLVVRQAEVDYFFCGRGCKLDFEEDPEHYLAPDYTPSM
jgi:YHS domain-containing protein